MRADRNRADRVVRFAVAAAVSAAVALALTGCSSGAGPAAGPNSVGGLGSPGGSPTAAGNGSPAAVTPLQPLPTGAQAALATYYGQTLAWQSCDQDFECAAFKVPLDYDHPGTGDLSLSAVRKRATGASSSRLGSLLLNPGGPGGSAVEYVEGSAKGFAPDVLALYDLIGLDPRGVGRSSPVSCLNGARMDAFTATDLTPENQAEIDALITADKEFAASCQQQSGAVLGHVSTVEAARDMDVLRALVGDDRLHYLGKSYGTLLGATYAGLFPSRVGRMVLDGALDPALDAVAGNRVQAGGFETAWAAFAKDCVKQKDCPYTSTQQADEQLTGLFSQLDTHPLATGSDRKLTKALATTGVIQAMYAEFLWPSLRTALTTAKAGDGTALLRLSDDYYERAADGTYPNLIAANMAVNCLDLPAPFADPAQVQRVLPEFEQVSPHFGRDMAWMALGCTYWPVRATGSAHTVRAAGAPPIVVIGTTRDPATPYAWAQSLAGQLESGRLLTYDGDGHTAYGRHNGCIDSAVNRYLLSGDAPAAGTRCQK